MPKFAWLYAFEQMRRQLLAAGSELQDRGLLDRADDIMFLDFREAFSVADGRDVRADHHPPGRLTHGSCGAVPSPGCCFPTEQFRRRSLPL